MRVSIPHLSLWVARFYWDISWDLRIWKVNIQLCAWHQQKSVEFWLLFCFSSSCTNKAADSFVFSGVAWESTANTADLCLCCFVECLDLVSDSPKIRTFCQRKLWQRNNKARKRLVEPLDWMRAKCVFWHCSASTKNLLQTDLSACFLQNILKRRKN